MPAPVAPTPATRSRTQSSDEVRVAPAPLWRRSLAFALDATVIVGVVTLFLMLASAVTGPRAVSELPGLDGLMSRLHALEKIWIPGAALGSLLALGYCVGGGFLFQGRTLGRAALGIRLVDNRGVAPAPGRAVTRAALAAVSVMAFFAGFWWALFDRKGQTWHDKLASTYVVR